MINSWKLLGMWSEIFGELQYPKARCAYTNHYMRCMFENCAIAAATTAVIACDVNSKNLISKIEIYVSFLGSINE